MLVLSTYTRKHLPLVINSDGLVDDNIDFEYSEDTQVQGSCSLTFRGDFYVFGGMTKSKQISKLVDCSLERVGEMKSWLLNGACASVADQKIYLCFSIASNEVLQEDWQVCRVGTDPLGPFEKITDSHFTHDMTRIAASEGQ